MRSSFSDNTKQNRSILLSLFLLAAILVVDWPIFRYPPIQDDWGWIKGVQLTQAAFAEISPSSGRTFYRPLGGAYIILMCLLFGSNAIGYHILALLIHFITALLLVYVVQKLTDDSLVSWASAFLYATCVTIHMDSMIWLVGIYSLGGIFFTLLCFALFLGGRRKTSLIAFFLGLCCVEATVFLPGLLVVYLLCQEDQFPSTTKRLKHCLLPALPFFLVLAAWLTFNGIRLLRSLPLPEAHAYAFALTGSHLPRNLILYGKWSAEALLPVQGLLPETTSHYFLFDYLISVGFWLFMALITVPRSWIGKSATDTSGNRLPRDTPRIVCGAWYLFGMVPIFFLTHHSFRYYLLYSLPPAIVLFYRFIRSIPFGSPRLTTLVVVAFTAINVFLSSMYFYQRDQEGLDQTYRLGSNLLIMKGATVKIVQNGLWETHPNLPKGATLVFDGVDVDSLLRAAAPQVWYEDSSLKVYDVRSLFLGPEGQLLTNSSGTIEEVHLDRGENVCLQPGRGCPSGIRFQHPCRQASRSG